MQEKQIGFAFEISIKAKNKLHKIKAILYYKSDQVHRFRLTLTIKPPRELLLEKRIGRIRQPWKVLPGSNEINYESLNNTLEQIKEQIEWHMSGPHFPREHWK